MEHKEIFTKVSESPNTVIHSIFHIGSQYQGSPLYDFIRLLDLIDLIYLFPDIKKSRIKKAIKNSKVIELLINEGLCGWIAEVSHPHIIGEDLSIHETNEHCSVIYSEDFQDLINKVLKESEKYQKMDLEKLKEK